MRYRKGVNQDQREGGEEFGGVERGNRHQDILYEKELKKGSSKRVNKTLNIK